VRGGLDRVPRPVCPSLPANPARYPWAIQGTGANLCVENVNLMNPYKGIDFGLSGVRKAPDHRRVNGFPLHVGIKIDQCADTGRILDVHFHPAMWQGGAP